ncbi:MAG: N-6 DNA methylase [Candidatus Sumerlaeota bacterium]|nr:N-6 DNA methylase [Candidatus Sumerlaeota bacterium]
MNPVEAYLQDVLEIHRSGAAVKETSCYPPLRALFNEVGAKLRPKVRCIVNLQDRGAGFPDAGLFTADQFQRAADAEPLPGQKPARGPIEVKSPGVQTSAIIESEQVARYLGEYGAVLVTNLREFVLVAPDSAGAPAALESFSLADDEKAFWSAAAHPRALTSDKGERLVEFLQRVLLHNAPLTAPEDLAWFLASYAREARARVDQYADLPALAGLKKGLEDALGMKFEGEKGEHFFRATLVQTLFYGVFSSWVLWARNHPAPGERFDWHAAGWTLHVPMIKSLFEQIATPTRLKPLRVDEVLNWAGMALNRVDRSAFFQKFEEERAVQYFYEPFLQAYDPELRKELDVWYTPPEIVQYQVERVDRVLREELNLADGLADDQVVILDPCCGTGAYLVETLKRIHRTLEEKGASALTAQKLKRAAMERVFGFEILPAPFVVSHLQLGLMLRHLGAPLNPDTDERVGVYLTNALTGWEPPREDKIKTALPPAYEREKGKTFTDAEQRVHDQYPELADEMKASREIKRDKRILVILGNPPYNAFAGTSPEEEGGLVEPYKEGLTTPVKDGGWGIKKFNLDDLYVRFFRIAERRIAKSGKGVVSFISNFSYLGDPSFVVMRRRFLEEFDRIWIDCMNGDSRETGKLTPDGGPDPSVFSTEQTAVGIRVGTAICFMVRKERREKQATVRFQHYWGVTKRQDVLASLSAKNFNRKYGAAKPAKSNRYSFRPTTVAAHYLKWPRVVDLCAVPPSNGLMEKRGGALIDIDREALTERMRCYFDHSLDWETVRSLIGSLAESAAAYDPRLVRQKALSKESFQRSRLLRYAIRPFDNWWCYYSSVPSLWNRSRPAYWKQCWEGNSFFVTRPAGVASPEGVPLVATSVLGDNDFQRGHSYYFPIRVRDGSEDPRGSGGSFFAAEAMAPYYSVSANLSPTSRAFLAALGIRDPDHNAETAALIWMHALAIGYSPAYLAENADGIRQDWPRIPLPASKEALLHSAELGRRLAALLDTDKPVDGVTRGVIRPELRTIAIVSKIGGGALDPNAGELDLVAGWGHAGQNGVCMPGKGRYVRKDQTDESLKAARGAKTLDVYLNDVAYWANIPEAVWNYYIGGYQVIKKWLSYREKPLLGRSLTPDEVRYVTEMARRLAALVSLQPELDENYREMVKTTTS